MNKIFTVTKNELIRYFISPLAYVYLLSFIILNGAFAFYFGGFFNRGIASLDSMFVFQPWLYLIFVPGISMRLWAEEFRSKTIIQIVTLPISINTIVWGKFLAAWAFCGIALVLTFPFWITVNILGNPDNVVIMTSYIASFLIAGCMLSISSVMSALTKNQVIALVLAFFANLMFFLSGMEFVLSFIRIIAPAAIVDMFASFSFLTHFNMITHGLFELRSIVFFLSIIFLFNFTTNLVITFKTSGTSKLFKSNNKSYYSLSFISMIICFIGINLTFNNLLRNLQIDFTEEKLFTLSKSTEKVLKEMPNRVIAKLYYSPILGQRNPDTRLMFDRVRIILDKYSSVSEGKLTYKIYSPNFLDRNEDEAISNGVQPIPIIDANINGFFGLTLSDDIDNKNVIPFFSLERQDFIEQDLTQKIYELYNPKKTIGLISSLEIGDTYKGNNMISSKWEIISLIEKLYNIKQIQTADDFDKTNFDVLVMVHPRNLSSELVDKIKKYSNNNGKVFLAVDGATESSRILITNDPVYKPSDLSGLDEFWGIKFHNDLVIADLDNSITVDTTQNYQTTPKFTQDIIQPKFHGLSINDGQIETANLKTILMTSVSPISPLTKDMFFMPLIIASRNSQLMPIDVIYNNIPPATLLKHFNSDKYIKVAAAKVKSKNPLSRFEMIVVGDTDFMYDTFWSEDRYILNNQYKIPFFDNANFVLNSLDSLAGNNTLIELRGRSAKTRRFEGIEAIRRNAQKDFAVKENEILAKIDEAKVSLQEVWNKRSFEGREIFTADELALIAGIRKNLDILREELSDIKSNSNKEMLRIEAILKAINIYAIPTIFLLYFAFVWIRKRGKKDEYIPKLILNRPFYILLGLAVILITIGTISVYVSDRSDLDKYENKPVFEDLEKNVNDIKKISIKTNSNSLELIFEDNLWKLENHKEFPVFQERVRSFLSSLIQATYYEKKSDKAEHLPIFGLQPTEKDGSKSTRIEIYNNENKVLTAFEVGKYDMDIGRGARSAYIKFDDKFQVWLVKVDFIDLSPDWHEWTYSMMWNLRYGRISNINSIEDRDTKADIVKDILNIHFSKVTDKLKKTKIISQFDISNEANDTIKISIVESDNKKYVSYTFSDSINNESLELFARHAKNKFFEIEAEDVRKLDNVIKLIK